MLKVYKNIRKASSTFVREYISTTKSARNDIEYQKPLLLLLLFFFTIIYTIRYLTYYQMKQSNYLINPGVIYSGSFSLK